MRVWANWPQLVSRFLKEAATSVQTEGQALWRGRRLRAEMRVVAVRTARAKDMVGRIVVKRSEYRRKLDQVK